MSYAVSAFLGSHGFVEHADVASVADSILFDMDEGLHGRTSDQDMIRTWLSKPEKNCVNKSVIVIDAGGTNFRSCLVTFDGEGNGEISFMEKTRMPGVERELGRTEFFDQIAVNLEHLKDKADCIGFCFSYPMEITEDGDGILLGFSKEVKAPEVVGSRIGKCLSDALVEHGWKRPKRVALLNDTEAALLAGVFSSTGGKKYSSYIGFILGTGMNAAYIQGASSEIGIEKPEIIVCEVGKFCKIPRSTFDIEFDKTSARPGTFFMEKSSSGAYLGPISFFALQAAARDGLFSQKLAEKMLGMKNLTLIELDTFLHTPYNTSSTLGAMLAENGTAQDYERVFEILDAIVERSARHAAAILVANVVKSGEGTDPTKPVCIVCNGTTYYKTYKIALRVQGYLEEILSKQRGLYWETVCVENDITMGAAIAGIINA